MKRYFIAIVVLSVFSCCNTKQAPVPAANQLDTLLPPVTDTSRTDSPKATTADNQLGSGLTQEELADDTVFADGSIPTSWEIAGISDVKAFKLFLKQVQVLVLNNDKDQLAKLIRYPLAKSARNEKDFVRNYDQIFSKDARLSVASINFSQLFRNSKGVMTEDGKVWFAQVGKDFRIIAINR